MCGHYDTVCASTRGEDLEAREAVRKLEHEKHLLTMMINDQRYVIHAPCAQPDVPVGCWTRMSVGYDLQKKQCVFLKDSWWVVHKDIIPEGDIYATLQLHGVRNVSHCINCSDIGDETYHTTQTCEFTEYIRKKCESKIITYRHYRLVLDTVGQELWKFKRSKDMVRAIHASLIGKYIIC